MASTVTGLPERYRPLDEIGPEEHTETGVIRCWRAKDRVLNRDVAIRVHTPAGPAAHAWITRALTAGGLATPALAMVYDASEGREDGEDTPGGAAYVVNEWIDGETLSDRLAAGPLPERETRTLLRRLADGVAEAHRVGLAVGGLTPDNVVLRPNGLVGLRAVPAADGSVDGDVLALGALLEACLTGLRPGEAEPRPLQGPSDLVALARRARSTDPASGLSSVAAMAAILAERPRPAVAGSRPEPARGGSTRVEEDPDAGWLRKLKDRRTDTPSAQEPVRLDPQTLPPVPPVRPVTADGGPLPAAALGGDTVAAGSVTPVAGAYARPRGGAADHAGAFPDVPRGPDTGSSAIDDTDDGRRHKAVVIGLPLLALLVVIGLAWWVGSNVLSVAGSVDQGSTPSAQAPSSSVPAEDGAEVAAGEPAAISAADVFDPEGDGEPENDGDVPLTFDGDPSTAWSTLTYRGSPAFGNLKPGVGIVYDLGEARSLAGVTVQSPVPGATVEIRTADAVGGSLDDFDPAASGTLEDSTDLAFDEAVEARYVLLWITGLVDGADGFSAEIGEVTVTTAG
ncbi:hypothetical protein [Blastococcus sp. TF02A-30]|uniref:hypothetical protein n=1 Tax=Blastococcus sp. TF02A-30 TaxID=2250580 RepID=UPI000DE95076|nr:hypothetical protein [Blastococcus sp. TF02A-30]RBY92656.1 hypothetical protein DQ241_00820 [Blastococcus sp. TF02A-30]